MNGDVVMPWDGLDLAKLTGAQSRLWWAGYARGVVDGIEDGRRLAEEEAAACWARAVEVVQARAKDMRTVVELERARGRTPTRAQLAQVERLRREIPA